jgi:succinyl-CoA synthetase alpha subunit
MSILINKDTKVITQGITGKTGQFHTRMCREYANGSNCFVAGVNPKKAGEDFEGIPIYATVKEAREATGATVSVIYVPPPFAAAAIDEAVDAGLDLVVCITEGIPVRDMIRTRWMQGRTLLLGRTARASSRRTSSRSGSCRATSTGRAGSALCRARAR